jgi:hypothetical protein
MMKAKFKKIICSLIGLMMGVALLAPSAIYAQTNATSAPSKAKNACGAYSDKAAKAIQKIADYQV